MHEGDQKGSFVNIVNCLIDQSVRDFVSSMCTCVNKGKRKWITWIRRRKCMFVKKIYKNKSFNPHWIASQSGEASSQRGSSVSLALKSYPDQPRQRITKWGSEYWSNTTRSKYEYVCVNLVSKIAVHLSLSLSLFAMIPCLSNKKGLFFINKCRCFSPLWYIIIMFVVVDFFTNGTRPLQ